MSSLRLAKLTQLMKEAQKQQVVTKSFGQRVDLYPNFNLFNDMKDSIYVEQKGRTVGDVEVLPGKTLSGCLTNSNLTVRFMGGKDSKVIDSNELRTLIPSLTVKAGELSPTLNISKVLNDISIKKFNSANKLAEMRKVANFTKQEIDQFAAWLTPLRRKNGDRYYDIAVAEVANNIAKAISSEYAINLLAGSNFKDYFRAYISFYLLSTVQSPFPIKAFRKDMGFTNKEKDLESLQSQVEQLIIDGRSDLPDPTEWNKKNPPNSPSGGRSGGGSTTGTPQGQTQTKGVTVQLLLPAGESVSDSWGTYTGIDANSFSYQSKDGQRGTYNNTKSGWKTSAEKINKMWADKSAGQTANSAAATTGTAAEAKPAEAAEPAKTETQKPAEATRQFDPSTLAGVKAVLIRAAKPGGFGLSVGTAANERRRIQKMIETISSSEGASIDAYDFLTKMLLVSPRGDTYLTAFFRGASQADIDAIMTSPRKDVVANPKGGKYNRQVAAVLSVLNEVYDGAFSKNNDQAIQDFKTKYVKKEASKLNNDITKTSSKVDPKIKKLATLRRLRVRSQMEEATESTTRFGRSRIS
jgi:hypothetical protein